MRLLRGLGLALTMFALAGLVSLSLLRMTLSLLGMALFRLPLTLLRMTLLGLALTLLGMSRIGLTRVRMSGIRLAGIRVSRVGLTRIRLSCIGLSLGLQATQIGFGFSQILLRGILMLRRLIGGSLGLGLGGGLLFLGRVLQRLLCLIGTLRDVVVIRLLRLLLEGGGLLLGGLGLLGNLLLCLCRLLGGLSVLLRLGSGLRLLRGRISNCLLLSR